MRCSAGRVLLPELLDHAPPSETRQNLAELVRINRVLGGHRILIDRLREQFDTSTGFTMLDIGAASGDMAAAAREVFPGLRVINLDKRALHLEDAPDARVVADAFRLPFPARSFDVVHCSLFLHHFTDEEVCRLLKGFWELTRRVLIVQDLERHILPYYFLPATRWLFRWSAIVLHDGPISVEAAFRPEELERLALDAGIPRPAVRRHRPAFRLSLTAVRS